MKMKFFFEIFLILFIFCKVNSKEDFYKSLNDTQTDIKEINKKNETISSPVIIDEKNINQNNFYNNNKKIEWINIIIISVLIMIIIYVIFYLYRYYRKNKYQNPGFYYKITEELFNEVTPIE